MSATDVLRSWRAHDVSVIVRPGTPEWPGDTPYSCRWTWDMAAGASVQVSAIALSPHVGTHADAPLHVRPGAPGSEALPLEAFMGAARVLTIDGAPHDVASDELLALIPEGTERVLLRTGRSIADGIFPDDWPALTPACAGALTARGIRLLGVDCPSVDRRASTALATHHALFDGGASVLENLDLRTVPDGEYLLVAPPLRLDALDAAPVRAVLYEPVT
ncbi:MAG TPA: cyclase family protein [Gemmatimonadaceae bacterium]|nr:cyclase family protein [Gemmatimonadaceae bacterium]